MQLTRHTDYALRLLLLLGRDPASASTVPDVARHYGVSEHHMAKVAQDLVHIGVLASHRGRGGGIVLAVRPEEIRIGALVARLEPSMDLAECFSDAGARCVLLPGCTLRGALHGARVAFLASLDEWTLADLLAGKRGTAPPA